MFLFHDEHYQDPTDYINAISRNMGSSCIYFFSMLPLHASLASAQPHSVWDALCCSVYNL